MEWQIGPAAPEAGDTKPSDGVIFGRYTGAGRAILRAGTTRLCTG